MNTVMPRKTAPTLEVEMLDGGTWSLADRPADRMTQIIFYRGLHCPICKGYLRELDRKVADFADLGIDTIVVSGDSKERAQKTKDEWELKNLKIGYGQSIDSMRAWGLYVSHSIKDEEPDEFGEPGYFILKPDRSVYYAAVNSMPFGRPAPAEVLGTVKRLLEMDYPARGEA